MFILFIFIFSQFKKKRIATIAIAPVKDKPKYSHATYTNNNKVYENVIASDKAICAIEHSNKNITSYYSNFEWKQNLSAKPQHFFLDMIHFYRIKSRFYYIELKNSILSHY